ncbi:hypothetical protein GOBAR_AA37822 [Gossypium barbadense]|uniref:RNase H type-1 domain-containing protein n=1 Tax=Gossypium barbadense TaxID=3634 RepID=A0A2P5VVN7_GOSBA|nr:hypothetical protein GOBAR_AA37822 [Gossypium barbadense]
MEWKRGSICSGNFVSNYLKELDGLNTNLPARRFHTSRWVAPNGLRIKINFDAAFNKQRNKSCSRLVVRNERAEELNLGLFLGLREVEIEIDSRLFIHRESNKVAHLIAKEGLQKREATYLLNMVTFGTEEAVVTDRRWTDSTRE